MVDEIVTASRVVRRREHQVEVDPPLAQSLHIRQNLAILVVEALIKTTRGFNLSEREAADFRHRSDRWSQEIKEGNIHLSIGGLSETQKFVSYIFHLNYQHRITKDATVFGQGLQRELISWMKTVASHPQTKLYINQAQGLLSKYTTAATLGTLDRVLPRLPEGLEPVNNSTYVGCLALYAGYVLMKDVTEIRFTTHFLLPIFFVYRFVVSWRGLFEEEDSHPLVSAVTPRNFPILLKVLGFLIMLRISHSKGVKNLLPKMARNSLVFNFLRNGSIPIYLTLRRYINANLEVFQ